RHAAERIRHQRDAVVDAEALVRFDGHADPVAVDAADARHADVLPDLDVASGELHEAADAVRRSTVGAQLRAVENAQRPSRNTHRPARHAGAEDQLVAVGAARREGARADRHVAAATDFERATPAAAVAAADVDRSGEPYRAGSRDVAEAAAEPDARAARPEDGGPAPPAAADSPALTARPTVAGALAGCAARGTPVLAACGDPERPGVRVAAAAHVDLAVRDGDVAAGRGHVQLPAGADRAAVAAEEVDRRRTDGVDEHVAAGVERHRSAPAFLPARADLTLLHDVDATGGGGAVLPPASHVPP